MDNFHMIKLKDKKCPICGNTKYMYHMSGRNVGSINVKCTNCNSYFRWDEISEQSELANNSPKLDNENGELISRQQMMREYQSLCSYLSCAECSMFKPYDYKCLLEEWIEKLPSIEPRKDDEESEYTPQERADIMNAVRPVIEELEHNVFVMGYEEADGVFKVCIMREGGEE